MAKQEKKISVNELEAVYTQYFSDKTVDLDYCGLRITIKKNLDLRSMLEFAVNVTESCFHETAGFMPEMMDFAIRNNVITYYTNVRLPQNLEKQYEFLYGCDLIDRVYEVIDLNQLEELVASIRKKIDERCDSNAQAIRREMQNLLDLLKDTFSGADQLFSGTSGDELKAAIQAVMDHGVDEGKIARAVLDAQDDQLVVPTSGGDDGA